MYESNRIAVLQIALFTRIQPHKSAGQIDNVFLEKSNFANWCARKPVELVGSFKVYSTLSLCTFSLNSRKSNREPFHFAVHDFFLLAP